MTLSMTLSVKHDVLVFEDWPSHSRRRHWLAQVQYPFAIRGLAIWGEPEATISQMLIGCEVQPLQKSVGVYATKAELGTVLHCIAMGERRATAEHLAAMQIEPLELAFDRVVCPGTIVQLSTDARLQGVIAWGIALK